VCEGGSEPVRERESEVLGGRFAREIYNQLVSPNSPVHLIITMIKWIRTSRLSIKNSLSGRFVKEIYNQFVSPNSPGVDPETARAIVKASTPLLSLSLCVCAFLCA